MDRKWKNQLRGIFEAPPPVRKRSFLREMEVQPMGMFRIFMIQFSLMSKNSWLLSLVSLGGIIFLNCFYEDYFLGAVLAAVPFLAAAGIAECARSAVYGMDELESASRFSLKSILLARLGMIGVENLLFAVLAALFAGGEFFQTILYILAPYLAAVCGSFQIVRHVAGSEGVYSGAVFSAVISMFTLYGRKNFNWIYDGQFAGWWLAAVLVLMFLAFFECRKMVHGGLAPQPAK